MYKKIIALTTTLFIVLSLLNTPSIQAETEKALLEEYDVIVVGGEPEGIAAAISAARTGAKTLLIEERDGLGGLFTYGTMNVLDLPQGIDGKILAKGIFEEWHKKVGRTTGFDIDLAKQVFHEMVDNEENLSLLLNTKIDKVTVSNQNIVDIQVTTIENTESNSETYKLTAKRFIDATQDADFAVAAGVPYFVGAEDIGLKDQFMASTYMIHLKGVDWNGIKETALSGQFGSAEVTPYAAWGFAEMYTKYEPKDKTLLLRGLNLVKIDEDYSINALLIFDLNGLDKKSKENGIQRGKNELPYVIDYLKKNFGGFENAYVVKEPKELYVRETRHILSEYQLPVSDLWENKDHEDAIAIGGYPVDIQASSAVEKGKVITKPIQYGIPYRSLVPLRVNNLLVVGRSGGYSSLAAGSVRVVPTGMATGEAAGIIAQQSIRNNKNFREIIKNPYTIIQARILLERQGYNLSHFELNFPYEDMHYYPLIKELLNSGALRSNYENNLFLDYFITNGEIIELLSQYIRGSDYRNNMNNRPPSKEVTAIINYLSTYEINLEQNATITETIKLLNNLPYNSFLDKEMLTELAKTSEEEQLLTKGEFLEILHEVVIYKE